MTSISDTNVVNAPGGLVELGQNSTDRTNVAVTGTSTSNATELVATTVVCDGSPIIIEFQCGMSVTNGEYLSFGVWVDGVYTATFEGSLAVAGRSPISAWSRLVPTAGAKTISIRWWKWSGGTSTSYIEGMCRVRVSKVIQASQLIVQTPNAPLVTSLPSNAIDGQEVRYLADNTNGIIWNFRYRAGSSSTYKWEFIGGVPLFSSYRMTETADSTTSNTYVDLGGPSIVAPLAGDYDVIITGNYYSGAASGAAFMSVNFGGATTLDDDGILFAQAAQYSHQESRKKIRKLNTITSGMTVGTRYRTYSGSTQSNFRRRTIELIPIRVSA